MLEMLVQARGALVSKEEIMRLRLGNPMIVSCVSSKRLIPLSVPPARAAFDVRTIGIARSAQCTTQRPGKAEQGYELVVRERDPYTSRFAEGLEIATHGVSLGLETVVTLLASGRFAGLIPTHFAQALRTSYRFVPMLDAEDLSYTSVFALIKVEDRQLAPSAELFSQLLLEAHNPNVKTNTNHNANPANVIATAYLTAQHHLPD